ncbi:MAG TPA: carboxypeptidase-like regulatory domain-containing protein [Baekduia sp.]|nr:carboxypeptidase-like regulatory domain-containing protein [Baekduia sp.]
MRRRAALWLAAPAAAGVAAASLVVGAAADSSSHQDSGVRGRVVPCGLVHERASPCASAQAGAGALVLVRLRPGEPPVAAGKADAHGRFRIALAPGTYLLEARMAGVRGASKAALRIPAVVRQDGWTTVMLLAGRPMATMRAGR